MIPEQFVGGWRRKSIALGDGAAYEDTDVIWLQAGDHFADLRIPRPDSAGDAPRPPQVMCFAGHTEWRTDPGADHPDRLRWIHDIDLLSWPADEGTVWFEGDELIEAGTFTIDGAEVPYTEVWHDLPGSQGSWSVHRTATAALVRVGDHSVTIVDERPAGGSMRAAYRTASADGWLTERSLGPDPHLLPEPPPQGSLPVASDGNVWTLVAASPAD